MHAARTAFRPMANHLLDALCPDACALCDANLTAQHEDLCTACREAVSRAWALAYCPRCGRNTPPFGQLPSGCGRCPPTKPRYDRVIRIGTYHSAYQALIRRFKFGGCQELDQMLTRELARRIAQSDLFESIDALTPVPTCWQHRLRRPFHPAVHIGGMLARRCGIPYAPLLDRIRGGPSQMGLSPAQRESNVRGKFRLARGCGVTGARLCLVDDVMTTGATVNECARILKRAGAQEVYVAVLARAGDDPTTLRHV